MVRSVTWGLVAAGLLLAVGAARAEATREALMKRDGAALLVVHAEGVQIYECATLAGGGAAWRFREPLATLMDGERTVGRHFAGPGWELTDGSAVRGQVVEQAAGESGRDIPWLRLAVVGRSGDGVLARATAVLRVDTHGGVFGGTCHALGALHLEPYSAGYRFLAGD